MTRSLCFVLSAALILSAARAQEAKPKAQLKTTLEQASYAIGLKIGRELQQDGLNVDSAAIVQGLVDALTNAKPKLTDAECQAAIEAMSKQVQEVMLAKNKVEGEKNRRDGQAFLLANKQKKGVITLPSGLQYTVLQSGKGARPTANDVVRVHYHGTLISGKVFDSSVEAGEPIVFAVGGVIRGWTEALQLMQVGDKWRLFIPSELAYGPDRRSADIGPHSVLLFDVELLGIQPRQ